jgi:hypothetical protein
MKTNLLQINFYYQSRVPIECIVTDVAGMRDALAALSFNLCTKVTHFANKKKALALITGIAL